MVRKINEDLSNISCWATNNGLVINSLKTQALWVGSRRFMTQINNTVIPSVVLNGTVINVGDSLKLLGITIDSTLSWREQCNITARKCFGALGRLRNCQSYLKKETKLILIKTLIFRYLDYCAGAFLSLSNELTKKFGRCKNTALRFVTGTKIYEHITPIYRNLEILSYQARRNFLTVCLLVKILNNNTPSYHSFF